MKFGGELVVDCKRVAVLDLLGLGLLGEHPLGGLPAGQRLQSPHQLPLRDVRLLLDLLLRGRRKESGLHTCHRNLNRYKLHFVRSRALHENVYSDDELFVRFYQSVSF